MLNSKCEIHLEDKPFEIQVHESFNCSIVSFKTAPGKETFSPSYAKQHMNN